MTFAVRMAFPSESPLLTQLATRGKAFWGYSEAQMEAWRRDLTISEDSITRHWTAVADVAGEAIGVIQIEVAGQSAELSHLWVAPEFMRQGVGRTLLQAGLDRLRSLSLNTLKIDSDPHALPFYLSCGARVVGNLPAPIDRDEHRVRPQLVIKLK